MPHCLSCFRCFCKPTSTTTDSNRVETAGILHVRQWGKMSAKFEDVYDTLYQIGEGKTGQVYAAKMKRPQYQSRAKTPIEEQQRERQERECDEEVAVKIVQKAYLSTTNRIEALQSELAILGHVKHPGILRLRHVFQDDDKFAIVTDMASGGEIMDAICKAGSQRVRECDIAHIVRQLLDVLAYLHRNGIAHRDVKVENIMCKTQKLQDGVLLVDFGLAHRGGIEMSGMNGTPHYMAPEMFRKHGRYDCAIDLWALGVVTYILLFGRFPFDAKFLSQIEDKIVQGVFAYPPDLESHVSPQAKKFIEYLLVLNPRERPPAEMALQHPWLQDDASSTTPFTNEHMTALAKFSEGKKVFVPPALKEYIPPKEQDVGVTSPVAAIRTGASIVCGAVASAYAATNGRITIVSQSCRGVSKSKYCNAGKMTPDMKTHADPSKLRVYFRFEQHVLVENLCLPKAMPIGSANPSPMLVTNTRMKTRSDCVVRANSQRKNMSTKRPGKTLPATIHLSVWGRSSGRSRELNCSIKSVDRSRIGFMSSKKQKSVTKSPHANARGPLHMGHASSSGLTNSGTRYAASSWNFLV
ncbi:hypothetical protein PsorP6_005081 [Peronosclerospora sorghi]|uniref:Uncharacterized protein n=1 Tax=Peronosclerospora sorghi TaxID=230839 RepID=A0ACC0W489_9STRA|nr:hypothetical protein PsorP6_005081 [Peronosclerospora sorghi]